LRFPGATVIVCAMACENASGHRKAQNKYVAKNPERQRQAVRKSYKRHRSSVLASKRQARASGRSGKSRRVGAPRKCSPR
jgi:hypothetical protein